MTRPTDPPEETFEQRCERLRRKRDPFISSPFDLAWHVGAIDDSMPAILAAAKECYSNTLHIREVVAPLPEQWIVRFDRCPGGWRVSGEVAKPFPLPRIRGARMPAYTRVVIPMRPDGIVPRSLAPSGRDLKRLIPGKWFGAGEGKRLSAPYVIVTIDAPGWGVSVNVPSTPVAPAVFAYPFRKHNFDRAIRAALAEARAIKAESVQRRINAHGLNRNYKHTEIGARPRGTPRAGSGEDGGKAPQG